MTLVKIMMNAPHPYLHLKLSLALFQKSPQSLSETETVRLHEIIGHQAKIETAILASPEALNVVVPEATVNSSHPPQFPHH